MTDLNVFAGAGGLALGLREAGFSALDLYEKDGKACDTLRYNLRSPDPTLTGAVVEGDVREVRWLYGRNSVRLLAAGAPCQPFSLGGKHKAAEDGRNLFPEIMRAMRELHPAAVVVENVRGLLREDFRRYFEYILRQIEYPSIKPRKDELWHDHDRRVRRHQCSVGCVPEYHVRWRLLNAADYGVPQMRLRVFMVATRYDLPPYRFPDPTHSRGALVESQRTGDYWCRHGMRKTRSFTQNDAIQEEEVAREPWHTVRDAIANLPPAARSEEKAWMNHWLIPGARTYSGHSGTVLDRPSKTIKAGVHGVPGGENLVVEDDGGVRYLTLRELARLQTFPDEHFFEGARIHVTRQLGNAVPVKLASAIARPLLELLVENHETKIAGVAYAAVI